MVCWLKRLHVLPTLERRSHKGMNTTRQRSWEPPQESDCHRERPGPYERCCKKKNLSHENSWSESIYDACVWDSSLLQSPDTLQVENEHRKRPGSVNSQSTWQTQMQNLLGKMCPQSFERIPTDKAPLKIKITILDYETFEEWLHYELEAAVSRSRIRSPRT